MPTTRIKNYRQHNAQRMRELLPNPSPPASKINKTGTKLTDAEMRRARRGVAAINRGDFVRYGSLDEALRDLCDDA